MNSRTLDRVMTLTWNRAVAADFTFDTPLNSRLIRYSWFVVRGSQVSQKLGCRLSAFSYWRVAVSMENTVAYT